MFSASKKLYQQSIKTFYIASKDYKDTGFQLGVLPPYTQKRFSEYTLGSTEDVFKIVNTYRSKNIVKSLYCSMCTLLEPDNYYVFNKVGNLVSKGNLAIQLHHAFKVGAIKFNLTATTPQYFYNHLLLSTEEHVSTYFALLDRPYFLAITSFIQEVSKEIPDIKGVFNGTFGSDTWHLHLHITDQKMAVLESLKKDLDISLNRGEQFASTKLYSKGIVVGRYFISKDPEKLFQLVSSYSARIFETDRSKLFMGANFFFHRGYHVVFLLLGKKIPPVDSVFFILPAFIANVQNMSPEAIDQADFRSVFQKIKNASVYQPITRLKPIDFPLEKLWDRYLTDKNPPVEAVQKIYLRFKTCDWVKRATMMMKILEDVDGCAHQGPKCPDPVRARYKFILSLFLICSYLNFGNEFYTKLLKNENFYRQAIHAEMAYLTKHFGIQKTDSMFLRGYGAQAIVQRTFKDLLVVSSDDPNRITLLDGMIQGSLREEDWIDYKFQKIGDPSAMGFIVPTNIRDLPKSRFIVKVNARYDNPDNYQEFAHEFAVGLQVNKLREKIPNFILTLGGFECRGDPPSLSKLCVPFTDRPMINYILLELVDSRFTLDKRFMLNLKSNLPDTNIEKIFFISVAQVMASLAWAQSTAQFTHYDLHAGNIMIYEYQNPVWKSTLQKALQKAIPAVPEVGFRYLIEGEEYTVPAPFISVVIDYGSSHIKGLRKPGKDTKWFTRSQFRRSSDVYSLLIYLFILIIQYRPSVLQKRYMNGFYRGFFNSYGFLFNRSFEEIVSGLMNVKRRAGAIPEGNMKQVLVNAMRQMRKDGQYYLYLPPLIDNVRAPFGSPLQVLKGLKTIIDPQFRPNLIYRWGDYPEVGLLIQDSTQKSQEKKIARLRGSLKKIT